MEERHKQMMLDAASKLIAVADDTGISLVAVIAGMERIIVEETKVGDALKGDVPCVDGCRRRGYTLDLRGRLVEVQ